MITLNNETRTSTKGKEEKIKKAYIKALHNEIEQDKAKAEKKIQEIKEGYDINEWNYIHDYITPSTREKYKENKDIKKLKESMLKKLERETEKKKQNAVYKINKVFNADTITDIKISVEWSKSRTWGANPHAEIITYTKNYNGGLYKGTASGCGYNKESAAIASAANGSMEILKALYIAKYKKDKTLKLLSKDVLHYGAGYRITPYLEGGVGANTLMYVLNSAGLKTIAESHGKTYDSYTLAIA